MKTKLFEWAKNNGYSLKELAVLTEYTERHLERIEAGEYPVNKAFRSRIIYSLGDWARSLFLAEVSLTDDKRLAVRSKRNEKTT